jgi:hypothetical protein
VWETPAECMTWAKASALEARALVIVMPFNDVLRIAFRRSGGSLDATLEMIASAAEMTLVRLLDQEQINIPKIVLILLGPVN